MFPTQTINNLNNNIDKNKTTITGKSFSFDFSNGDFLLDNTGNLISVNNLEALEMWISKILKTDKNKFVIYDNTSYGINSLLDIVTTDFPLEWKKAEIEKQIRETLSQNTAIKNLGNFTFKQDKRTLYVSFNVYTIFGDTKSEVII